MSAEMPQSSTDNLAAPDVSGGNGALAGSLSASVASEGAGHVPGHVAHVRQNAYETGYMVLVVFFVSMLLLTNIIGTKLFELPMDTPYLAPVLSKIQALIAWLFPGQGGNDALVLTTGIVTYPLTFLCTDIVSEVYGRRRADRMVMVGFGCSLAMLVVLALGVVLPPADVWMVPGTQRQLVSSPGSLRLHL
ncbi:MAG: uncharacterized PurR-regulated membrane protein YhhQ (DUF165 family) [Pseudohongiellaceae bacterium]|jgi:uncharacterized PurR-regulated membrane protein YhhQ (DUF165 family)